LLLTYLITNGLKADRVGYGIQWSGVSKDINRRSINIFGSGRERGVFRLSK